MEIEYVDFIENNEVVLPVLVPYCVNFIESFVIFISRFANFNASFKISLVCWVIFLSLL